MWKQFLVLSLVVLLAYWFFRDDKLHTLQGKRVLVTGSSSGIGEQIAYHYARLGASVVVTARRVENLNKVVKECQTLSSSPTAKFFALPADMSKLDETKRVIEQSVKHLGGLDILVLNHLTSNPAVDFTGSQEVLDNFHKKMDINFRSYVHLASHALPQLKKNEGNIIVVNSLAGKIPQAWLAEYSASKFALNGFFTALKNQFLVQGVNVSITSCYLGLIGTDMAKSNFKGDPDNPLMKLTVMASPKDTALDIIKGGAQGASEVYSPFLSSWLMVLIHGIWPAPVEYITRVMMTVIAGFD